MEQDPWGRGPNQEGASGHAEVTTRTKTKRVLAVVWGAPVVRVEEEGVAVAEAADSAEVAWETECVGIRALDVCLRLRKTKGTAPQRPLRLGGLSTSTREGHP